MSNEILIVVLLTILSHPSKEAPLRFKRGTGTSSINDGISQKGFYTLVDGIMSLVSPNIVENGAGHALYLRSVADKSANNSSLGHNNITNKKANTESLADLEAKDLYNLLNKIISLIMETISQARSNRNASPEKKDNETHPVASSTTANLENSSHIQVSHNITTLVTTSSTLTNNGSTNVGNTTNSVHIKTARETNIGTFLREKNIDPKEGFTNESIGTNNLAESIRNIFPRSDSGGLTLDKPEDIQLENDTKSFLMSNHSNSPDSSTTKKDRRNALMLELSEDVKSDSKNLEAISNEFSNILSAPRGIKESDLLQIPKLRGSLRWNLVDSDSPSVMESDFSESNLNDQLASDESNHLQNKEYISVDNDKKQSEEHYDRKIKSIRTNPTRKSNYKRENNNKMCKIVKVDNTGNTEGSGDSEMNTFVCSFTIEISSGDGDSEKPGHHSHPDRKGGNKLLHALRKPNLRNKSKVGRRQFPVKDEKTHYVRNEPNYNSEKGTANSSSWETPEVRQNESTKKNDEHVNGVHEKRHHNSANTVHDRGKDERKQNKNSNSEDEKRMTSEKNTENLEKSHKSNRMSNKETNKQRHQNSDRTYKLNNMAADDGQDAVRNSIELHSSHSQPELEDDDPSGNKKELHAEEKYETNAGSEVVNSNQNELSDRNSNLSPEKEEEEEVEEEEGETGQKNGSDKEKKYQNRRIAKFSENMKAGYAEADDEEGDYKENDGDLDSMKDGEEEAEEEAEEYNENLDNEEVQHDENDERIIKHLSRKNNEEMESAIQDDYDL